MQHIKNKQLLSFLSIVGIGFLFFLTVLVGVLFLEYRYFCVEAQKMLALQAQYRNAVRMIYEKNNQKEIFEGELVAPARGDYWGVRGDDFILVNRDPVHLKNSMVSYLKDLKLDGALSRIDANEWLEYTGHHHSAIEGSSVSSQSKVAQSLRRKQYRPITKKRVKTNTAFYRPVCAPSFFVWPIEQDRFWLSSFFGPRKKANGLWGRHDAIDMAAMKGTEVKAVASGIVLESRYDSGYGNMILLHHDSRYKTRFAHLDKIFVKRGQTVHKGQVIGTVGDTGFIRKKGKDGSHLHFEVYSYNKRINPLTVLPRLT